MAGHEDYTDDPLGGSEAAQRALEQRQPETTPDEMLSDFDDRQARRIAHYVASIAGIVDAKTHRKQIEWVAKQMSRCQWWSDTISNVGRDVVRWAVLGVGVAIVGGLGLSLKAWLGL